MGILKDLAAQGAIIAYGSMVSKIASKIPGDKGEVVAEKAFNAPFKAVEGIINTADSAIKKVDDALANAEEKQEKQFRDYLMKKEEDNPSFNHLTLLFDMKSYGVIATKSKAQYSFIDSYCNQVYYAMGKDNKHKQHITVFSQHNQKIGEIVEKPKFMDMGTSNYVIRTASGKMVSMNTRRGSHGNKYEIIPLNWYFCSTGFGKHEVFDEKENMLMRYTNKPFSFGRVMHIEYKEKNDEDVAVLIALSIYANVLMEERHSYKDDSGYTE